MQVFFIHGKRTVTRICRLMFSVLRASLRVRGHLHKFDNDETHKENKKSQNQNDHKNKSDKGNDILFYRRPSLLYKFSYNGIIKQFTGQNYKQKNTKNHTPECD